MQGLIGIIETILLLLKNIICNSRGVFFVSFDNETYNMICYNSSQKNNFVQHNILVSLTP